MERNETMMRAARYVLGAGTIAVAMIATTAQTASAGTCRPAGEAGEYPSACGFVFTDSTQPGNNIYEPGEGVGNVTVYVTTQTGEPVTYNMLDCTGSIDPCGYFSFANLPPSDTPYLFCVVDATHTETDCSKRDDSVPVNVTSTPPPTGVYTEIELVPPTPPPSGVGTGTPGYWKNHPTVWPSTIEVGGVTYVKDAPLGSIDQKVAIGYMGKVSGDKTLTMFAALISAKLNLWAGTKASCIQETVDLADAWMVTHKVGSIVKASHPDWSADSDDSGSTLHQLLDDYNNGRLCAPHRN
jgi:hypothetical protein